jgi:hypothetical protein
MRCRAFQLWENEGPGSAVRVLFNSDTSAVFDEMTFPSLVSRHDACD